MRPGFMAISEGWTLVNSFADITQRIEELAKWSETNGPLEPDEEATVRLMIECQIARAQEEGQGLFDPPKDH